MRPIDNRTDRPVWVEDYAVWNDADERDFLAIMKVHHKFTEATGDAKLAGVLVMAWATLQTQSKEY